MLAEPVSVTAEAAGDLYLCGWRLRSTLPLPELAPWTGDQRQPDLTIRTGAIPTRLEGAIDVSPLLQVTVDKQARLSIDGVATYWLRSPGEVVIDPQMELSSPDIRTLLFGTLLGLLCHRRGLLPLHASSVKIGGRAIAISGVSGAGKSTLAAALTRRGHALISDDVCAIDSEGLGGPVVLPAFPRVKLWNDSLAAVGLDSTGLTANRVGQPKFYYRFNEAESFQTTPAPLKAIYLLSYANAPLAGRHEIETMAPTQRIIGLHAQIYRKRTAAIWGLEPSLFKALGRIAGSVDVYRLTRTSHLDDLAALVGRLEAHAA